MAKIVIDAKGPKVWSGPHGECVLCDGMYRHGRPCKVAVAFVLLPEEQEDWERHLAGVKVLIDGPGAVAQTAAGSGVGVPAGSKTQGVVGKCWCGADAVLVHVEGSAPVISCLKHGVLFQANSG